MDIGIFVYIYIQTHIRPHTYMYNLDDKFPEDRAHVLSFFLVMPEWHTAGAQYETVTL